MIARDYTVTLSSGGSIYFCTLCNNCYKMQTFNSIASIFGTNQDCIKVNSRTKFAVHLMNIQGDMSVYSRKTSVMATG